MPLSWNLGTPTSWNPLGHSRPVTGLIYLFIYYILYTYFWPTLCMSDWLNRGYWLEDSYSILHIDIEIYFFLQSIEWILALCGLPTNRRGPFLVAKEVTDHLHLGLRILNLYIHLRVFSVAFITFLTQCKLVWVNSNHRPLTMPYQWASTRWSISGGTLSTTVAFDVPCHREANWGNIMGFVANILLSEK